MDYVILKNNTIVIENCDNDLLDFIKEYCEESKPKESKKQIVPKGSIKFLINDEEFSASSYVDVLRVVAYKIGLEKIRSSGFKFGRKYNAVVSSDDSYIDDTGILRSYYKMRHECGNLVYREVSDGYYMRLGFSKNDIIRRAIHMCNNFGYVFKML